MIVKFEFDTGSDDFNDAELQEHYQAADMAKCLYEIKNKLRSWDKYREEPNIPVEEVTEEIYNIIEAHVNMQKMGY